MNPDGYEVAKEGECSPDENILGRLNANLVDLAGSFPDIRIQDGIYENRQPETLSVINWIDTPDFLLSITFFAGEIFAAYPYFTVDILLEYKICKSRNKNGLYLIKIFFTYQGRPELHG